MSELALQPEIIPHQRAISDIRKQLVRYCHMAFARGLSSGVSGNYSARILGTNFALIKVTGISFAEVTEDDFVLVDLDGNKVYGEGVPSKEVHFHCGIYRVRPDVNAVLHGHAPYVTAYVSKRKQMNPFTAAAQGVFKEIGVVKFAPSGSMELADMVVAEFCEKENLRAVILYRHGFVVAADTIARSFYWSDVLEDNAITLCAMESMKE